MDEVAALSASNLTPRRVQVTQGVFPAREHVAVGLGAVPPSVRLVSGAFNCAGACICFCQHVLGTALSLPAPRASPCEMKLRGCDPDGCLRCLPWSRHSRGAVGPPDGLGAVQTAADCALPCAQGVRKRGSRGGSRSFHCAAGLLCVCLVSVSSAPGSEWMAPARRPSSATSSSQPPILRRTLCYCLRTPRGTCVSVWGVLLRL